MTRQIIFLLCMFSVCVCIHLLLIAITVYLEKRDLKRKGINKDLIPDYYLDLRKGGEDMQLSSFIIPLAPVTKKNSQRLIAIKRGSRVIPKILPSAKYEQYLKACANYLPVHGAVINFPCQLTCMFYMETRRRVDLTNLLEAIDDVLVYYHIIEDDNSNIVVSHDGSRVLYDKDYPRTEIYIYDI